jgi:pSer/pThr/pTyr-binding forkhead associated (FHA) protein
VDICVKDQSISRIHARIDYNGASYTVTDLNSTNGTYVNGMQLDPNETVELTEGDEVRFGELNYCLR